jgi:hypothetical protein
MHPSDQVLGNCEERSLTLWQVQTLQIGNAAIRIAVGFLLRTEGQQDQYLLTLFNLLVRAEKVGPNGNMSKQIRNK